MGTPTQVCVWSCPNFSALAGRPFRVSSHPAFLPLTGSDKLVSEPSSRVPIPLPKDPYEAIRQDYLDGTDTESEPFEDPIDKKTLESPLTIAPPTSLSDSVPPLVPILRRTVRMAVCVPPAMLSGLSANMAEVTTMPGSAFIRGLSPLTRVRHLCHRQTFLYGSVIGDAKDKGSIVEDEDPAARDEGLAAGVEGL
ncbi:hypothetical protein Tco_1231773, partial [Tanacetum coccineum]